MIIDGYTAELLIDRAIGGTTLDESVKALQDVFVDHDLLDALRKLPSVDAVEVVRCKDCKHYIDHNCYERNHINIGLFVHDNNYCSWAERRTDA